MYCEICYEKLEDSATPTHLFTCSHSNIFHIRCILNWILKTNVFEYHVDDDTFIISQTDITELSSSTCPKCRVTLNLEHVRFVDNDNNIIEKLRKNGLFLKHVLQDQTLEMCMTAVQQNGYALEFVKEQTLEICMTAVKKQVVRWNLSKNKLWRYV